MKRNIYFFHMDVLIVEICSLLWKCGPVFPDKSFHKLWLLLLVLLSYETAKTIYVEGEPMLGLVCSSFLPSLCLVPRVS
jgi:hypothetical protein